MRREGNALSPLQEDEGNTPPATTPWHPDDDLLAVVERRHVELVLARCNGNKSEAARRLGIHRTSLLRKLRGFTAEPSKPSYVDGPANTHAGLAGIR